MKGKIMIIAVAIIFLTVIIMATAHNDKNKIEVSGTESAEISDIVYQTETKEPEEKKSCIENYEEILDKAKYITIEKVIRTTVEHQNGESKTVYDTYFVSDVNLAKGNDNTENFAMAVSGEEYDEELIVPVNFLDAFGFDYQGLTARDIYENLLLQEGFSDDLSKVTYDDKTHEVTGQDIYVLEDAESVIEKLLPEHRDKNVIESKAYYQTVEEESKVIPDYFAAIIRYKEGEQVIEKSIYLQITVNNWEVE